jgi:hypothetical protein
LRDDLFTHCNVNHQDVFSGGAHCVQTL